MKHLVLPLILTLSFTTTGFSQMLLPEFEGVKKMEILSSEAEESMPIPFNQGNNFYFFRTYIEGEGSKTKVLGQDIWFAEKKKEEWLEPYRLFRSDYLMGDNSIIGTNEDGSRVYLFSAIYKKDTTIRKIIYLDKTGKDKWAKPVEITIPGLEYGERYYSFSINKKETVLMISMSPSNTLLDEDLYVSLKQDDGSWGTVIDLGEVINTRKVEISPFLANDDKTLYFSSEGHGGLGESDIFVSYRIDDSWTKWTMPLNLEAPINSEAVEAYFVLGNNEEVYFTSDRNDNHSNIFSTKSTGKVRFAHQDAQFTYEGLPADNITLEIYDLDGNLIDEIVTDEYGNFSYRKLSGDGDYVIKISEDDFTNLVGGKVYLVDENGKKISRYTLDKDGAFKAPTQLEKGEAITGVFNFKSLPQNNAALVILDENNFPLDTIYTDGKGNFSYQPLSYDDELALIPSDVDETEWNDLEIFLTDKDGNRLSSAKMVNGKLVYTKQEHLAEIKKSQEVASKLSDNKQVDKSASIILKEGWNGLSAAQKRIYFQFAENTLTADGKMKLDALVSYLKDNSRAVELIGHTDNVGQAEANKERGLNRASAAKAYLISKGIEKNRFTLKSMGEEKPIASNDSAKGREENRRVEVLVK